MSVHRPTLIFSFWAWIILAPPLITAWGGYASAVGGHERVTGLLAAIVVHLLLGVCFWLAALVERRLSRTWRWAWFAVVVLAISLARPYLADQLQAWAGLHLTQPDYPYRFGLNVIGLTIVLLIVYISLEQVDRAADSRRRLALVLDHTEQQRTTTEVRHAALILDFQRTIADPIRQALASVRADRPPAEVADALMRVANDVVRPLTDRTFAMDETAMEYQYRPHDHAAAASRQLRTPHRVEATLPWGPAAVWFALQLPMGLLGYPPLLGTALTVASTAVVLLGSWLIGRQTLPASTPAAVTLLAAEYGALGALGTLVLCAPAPAGATLGYWIYSILLYAVVGTTLSIGRSNHLGYLASEPQLVQILLDARFRANEAHGQLAATTNLLARRLHATIQADVVAAALQIRVGTTPPVEGVAQLTARVERVLGAPMLHSSIDGVDSDRPFADGIRAAILAADQAWRQALDLAADYDESLWTWLAEHPDRRAFLREAVTRGLTDILRYSRARRAGLSIRVDGEQLRIEVRYQGRLLPRDYRLTRPDAFRDRSATTELVQEGGEVVYRVVG